MEESEENTSSVIQLLDCVWDGTNRAVPHSWERLNHAMRDAMEMAIAAGFLFVEGDFSRILNGEYRAGYWIGESSEWIYAEAIAVGNMSAIKDYEAYRKREPFIADGVQMDGEGRYLHIKASSREKERLYVGARFTWKGLSVKVNSFSEDQSYLNAAHYERKNHCDGKILKRFKITREDIIADRAERKERTKLLSELTTLAEKQDNSPAILKALGVKKREELDSIPIAKVREVHKQFTSAA